MIEEEKQLNSMSFMKLIQLNDILIPYYQREYSQGRLDKEATYIRKHLIADFFDALETNKHLDLNFIYGGTEEKNKVSLVDGQQRVTSLFLLHWYIFIRSGDDKSIINLLNKFVYSARKTTARFCESLIGMDREKIDFNLEKISTQVKNEWWFTGSMSQDSTVRSMLVVLDEIHNQTIKRELSNEKILQYKKVLLSKECPITVLYLNMDEDGKKVSIHDLYLKMNSRGKPLTDFEIFKSQLQKSQPVESCKNDLLKHYLGDSDSNENRIKLIGDFNVKYTNAFFKIVDDGVIEPNNKFDLAMMNAVNVFFRFGLFRTVKNFNNFKENAKEINELFSDMSGKELISFIEQPMSFLEEKCEFKKLKPSDKQILANSINDVVLKSFKTIIKIFNLLSDFANKENSKSNDLYYFINEKKVVSDFANDITLQFLTRCYGLFAYWEKIFGDTVAIDNDEYNNWLHFVHVITYQVAGVEELYKAIDNLLGYMSFFDWLLTEIENGRKLNEVIAGIDVETNDLIPTLLKQKVLEEQLKIKLSSNSQEWKCCIEKAEKIFASNRVMFIFELAKNNECSYDIDLFKKYSDLSLLLFYHKDNRDELEYKLNKCFNPFKFEQAMLSISKNEYGHLINVNNDERHQFIDEAYASSLLLEDIKDVYCDNDVIHLFKKLIDCKSEDEINTRIQSLIGITGSFWKDYFLNGFLKPHLEVNGFSFSKTVSLNDDKHYLFLYNTDKRKSNTAEIQTFALAAKLSENDDYKDKIKYVSGRHDDAILDENNFPIRHVEFVEKNVSIGFKYDDNDKKNGFYIKDKEESYLGKNIGEALQYIEQHYFNKQ